MVVGVKMVLFIDFVVGVSIGCVILGFYVVFYFLIG